MNDIAIITGASSGMGKEFVLQLDGQFDEIWGIGLGADKLEKIKSSLKGNFRYFDLDLTNQESFDFLISVLNKEKPNVKFLANCAGFGKFGRYDEIDIKQSANMIDLNCKALMQMTEYVLPFIGEGGKIIQIASVAGFQPVPYMAVYGASKAFVLSYSRALNQELKNKKIKVTTVCPFWTKTAFFDRAKDTLTKNEVVTKYIVMYDPKKVVKKAIKDSKKGKEISICGFIARSQVRLVNILPKKLVMRTWIKQQKFNKKYKNI